MEGVFEEAGVVVVVAVVALVVLQLSLQLVAIVQLAKTPSERVTIGGRKWVWALIILLGELAGPIVWFVLGRKPAEVADTTTPVASETRGSAIDTLYGPKE